MRGFTDLSGTCHLNPSVSLKYSMPLKRKGGDTLASPARGLPLKSLKSVMSLKKMRIYLSGITDLSGTCHLNPFMPLKYFMPLKKRGE